MSTAETVSVYLDSVVKFCERDASSVGQHLSREKSQERFEASHDSVRDSKLTSQCLHRLE